jgi:hypothetical protein
MVWLMAAMLRNPTTRPRVRFAFDVSRAVTGLTPAAASNLVLTLHYIPAPSPTGEPQADPELVKEVQLDAVLLESYAQP